MRLDLLFVVVAAIEEANRVISVMVCYFPVMFLPICGFGIFPATNEIWNLQFFVGIFKFPSTNDNICSFTLCGVGFFSLPLILSYACLPSLSLYFSLFFSSSFLSNWFNSPFEDIVQCVCLRQTHHVMRVCVHKIHVTIIRLFDRLSYLNCFSFIAKLKFATAATVCRLVFVCAFFHSLLFLPR